MVDIRRILSACDHTLLTPTASSGDVRRVCDEALRLGTASVCIPPCFVAEASAYLDGRVPVCTVTGFPNGYSATSVKCFETAEAIADGADEIDMTANISHIKAGRYDELFREISEIKRIAGARILKVIVETCLLTDEEKIRMCSLVADAGADFIKTSTGFSSGGATREDVALMAAHLPAGLSLKASGGIRSLEDAQAFLDLGASRLGSSRLAALAEQALEAGR
ncbi:MAG: deoxyribose-phosphate aldolase [Oscillospiraceae bacterium]|jgi:deoxyribose-phosphate aldolase|nr:deoxyribose-phosphate aldolase [Oscillospiraceae bacterium]